MIHIIPKGDVRQHSTTPGCWCMPHIESSTGCDCPTCTEAAKNGHGRVLVHVPFTYQDEFFDQQYKMGVKGGHATSA